jgi:hypothetical protein
VPPWRVAGLLNFFTVASMPIVNIYSRLSEDKLECRHYKRRVRMTYDYLQIMYELEYSSLIYFNEDTNETDFTLHIFKFRPTPIKVRWSLCRATFRNFMCFEKTLDDGQSQKT